MVDVAAWFDPEKREPRVKLTDLATFVRQLATMITSGIPLHHGLAYLCDTVESPDLRRVLEAVTGKVESGMTFSRTLREYPRVFNPVIVGLMATGEMTGRLGDVLQRVADLLERQVAMQKRIVATVTYPAILLAISLLSAAVFICFVLPTTVPLFQSLHIRLPGPTRFLLECRYTAPLAAILLAGCWLVWYLVKDDITRYLEGAHPELLEMLQSFPLKNPVFGSLYTKVAVSRILFALATMIDNGVALLPALRRASATTGNHYLRRKMGEVEQRIKEGELLAPSLASAGVFPDSAIHLIRAGEETSRLSDMLAHAANIFEEEVELELARFSSLIEPAIMICMGVFVGFIVISTMLPMMRLIQNM